MTPEGIISALVAGALIGLIARILVPGMQPIGCIMTILLGIVGAFAGIFIGNALGFGPSTDSYSFWLVLLVQIVTAVILVAITAAIFRKASST